MPQRSGPARSPSAVPWQRGSMKEWSPAVPYFAASGRGQGLLNCQMQSGTPLDNSIHQPPGCTSTIVTLPVPIRILLLPLPFPPLSSFPFPTAYEPQTPTSLILFSYTPNGQDLTTHNTKQHDPRRQHDPHARQANHQLDLLLWCRHLGVYLILHLERRVRTARAAPLLLLLLLISSRVDEGRRKREGGEVVFERRGCGRGRGGQGGEEEGEI